MAVPKITRIIRRMKIDLVDRKLLFVASGRIQGHRMSRLTTALGIATSAYVDLMSLPGGGFIAAGTDDSRNSTAQGL